MTEIIPIIVVGSGPSSIAVSCALLERGRAVLMLDAGLENEATSDKNQHTKKIPIKNGVLKLSYGSDYIYRDVSQHYHYKNNNKAYYFYPSFAKGGLSNVWGACTSRYDRSIFENEWGTENIDWKFYYDKTYELLGVNLSRKQSRQSLHLHKVMSHNKKALKWRGFTFKHPSLAVQFNQTTTSCSYCGLCMYGCPDKLIYSTNKTLTKLLNHRNFSWLCPYTAVN